MAGERLRKLERAWQTGGDPSAGIAYALELIRLGRRPTWALYALLAEHEPEQAAELLLTRWALGFDGEPDLLERSFDDAWPQDEPDPWKDLADTPWAAPPPAKKKTKAKKKAKTKKKTRAKKKAKTKKKTQR